jgi:hypothetical protein
MRQVGRTTGIGAVGLALSLVLAVGSVGCDRGEPVGEAAGTDTGPTAVERRARAFLKAVQYRDVERAFDQHLEQTDQGVYCASDGFQKVLERTRDEKTEKDCEDARKMSPQARAALEDDAELLVQILRFACEQPEGTCRDYARQVFTSQLPRTDFWRGLENFEIREVHREGASATAYVDYWTGAKSEASLQRRALKLRRVDGDWVVATSFGEKGPEE